MWNFVVKTVATMLFLQIILSILQCPTLAWKTIQYETTKIESYEIQEFVDKSGFDCFNHCTKTSLCHGVIYNENCILITKPVISSGGTQKALLIKNEVRAQITKIEIKTASTPYTASTSNPVSTEICGENGKCCKIDPFASTNLPFEVGKLTSFIDEQLYECLNFGLNGLKSVKISVFGPDGWLGEYMKIYLKNKGQYFCEITNWLGDGPGNSQILNCKYYSE